MNVWFDLCHIPQYNFYRNLILRLTEEGHNVFITILRRGKLPLIVFKELDGLQNVHIDVIGCHRMTRISAIVEANLIRNLQLLRWAKGKHIDVALSNGYAAAWVGHSKGFPSFSFDDDPQTIDYRPKLWWNKKCCFCLYELPENWRLSPKAVVLPVLKEWAYLSPNVFHPDLNALSRYNVSPRSYVFLREVSVGTVNYARQGTGAVLAIKEMIPKGVKVLFSLEEKEKRSLYPNDWILLQEPVNDIHSLIYYSAGLVSSGDSMAREGALLGVPSYYLGIRSDMPANRAAANVADMQNAESMSFREWTEVLTRPEEQQEKRQIILREKVSRSFLDINEYMYNTALNH